MSQAVHEGRRTYRLRAVGVAAIVAVGLAAVSLASVAALFWAIKVSLDRVVSADELETARAFQRLAVVGTLVFTATQFLSLGLAMIWLWRARKNLDAFPGAAPNMSQAWVVAGWFVPFANFVVPGRIAFNVARQSTRERSVAAAVVVWWVGLLVAMFAYRAGAASADSRRYSIDVLDLRVLSDYYSSWATTTTVGAAAGLLAAAGFAFAVTRISTAQEERIHRGWYEDQNRALAASAAGEDVAGAA
ncbi:protein of unknown function [Asanoa hainanensis]|uniref:DUF4328 domain-containing protein n=1 Tax=Asanoa hainanensis TaxID=560556 RepID=A0A239IB54_9ACTN|nr:DUF4328 domain-containing protein [Asanoa hainanensis]SNS90508.1 protein of unknown function [Asanoa hainanensis]